VTEVKPPHYAQFTDLCLRSQIFKNFRENLDKYNSDKYGYAFDTFLWSFFRVLGWVKRTTIDKKYTWLYTENYQVSEPKKGEDFTWHETGLYPTMLRSFKNRFPFENIRSFRMLDLIELI
jgi:hypothetical protein